MTMQLLCAYVLAFLFTTAFGKGYIPWLVKEKARQEIKTDGLDTRTVNVITELQLQAIVWLIVKFFQKFNN